MDFLVDFSAMRRRRRAARATSLAATAALWALIGPLALPPTLALRIGEAWAAPAAKAGLALIPVARRDGVSPLTGARVEEYLRAMIEAGGIVTLVAAEDVETGRARRASKRATSPQVIEAQKNLDKADEALIAGRDGLAAGDDLDTVYALLSAAIGRYERYFLELNDFTKLVDAYARAADAALRLGKKAEAKANITKGLTIQPTLVLDRKATDELREMVKETREALAGRKPGNIEVVANVEGAKVFIDGIAIGDAPCEAKDLYPGTHYVQVRKEGADTVGKAVTVRGGVTKAAFKIEIDEEEGTEIAIAVRFDDIRPIAEKGNYHEKVAKNFSFMFSKQLRARFLLYGVLAKSLRGVELHMFLYDATLRKFAALEAVEFASNLSNMQMKILEAEGLIRAAISSFPESKEVVETPPVYSRAASAAATSGSGVPVPPVVAPGTDPAPTPEPKPDPAPKPDPEPEPQTEPEPPRPAPVVDPPKPKPKPIAPKTDPYANLVHEDEETSVVKTWWFWTLVGVAAAGGATAAVLLLGQEPAANGSFKVDAVYQP